MNYRIASLLASESATTPTTKTLDVNIIKPISRLTVEFKGTNNSDTPTAHPAKMVKKIELVDGSNVLFSLSGIQAQALNYFETGRMPLTVLNYVNNEQAIACFELNFGRWLWDEILAFDPKKFQNPQLKITHDLALGGSVPDAATMSVFAHCFDGKAAAPTGFLLSKEQYSYTLVASAKEKIDLATDLPYRMLLVRSLTAGKQPWEQFNQIKLSEDNDNVVVINDEKTSDLIKLFADLQPIIEGIQCNDLLGGVTVYMTPTYEVYMGLSSFVSANATLQTAFPSGGAAVLTGDDNEQAMVALQGRCPHGAVAINLGNMANLADWYDVSKIGSLALILTAGTGASGTAEIISQQVKMYK